MINRVSQRLLIAIGIIILIRLFSLQAYPFMDTTEARYGEMARLMIETNNWVTPFFDYDVPFWGKPPMQTWVSAASGAVLGVSEFSLRLPHLLAGILTLFVAGFLAKAKGLSPLLTALTLLTTVGFYAASGAVMTDTLLTLSMAMSMVGFYLTWEGKGLKYAYLGFVGIGLGLLIKGPLIIVLVGLAIAPWLVVNYGFIDGFKRLWARIPLISGLTLSLLVAGPWYLMAELATPGFLDYFIIGEHWSRFTVSGWDGDLYGNAHTEIRGTIWWFWLYVALPWSFVLIYFLVKPSKRKEMFKDTESKRWHSFLLFWLISPMVLFTLAGNVLPMYVLPGLPALALLIISMQRKFGRLELGLSCFAPALICLVMILGDPTFHRRSDKVLLSHADITQPIYYVSKRSFSGRFYTKGQIKLWEEHQKSAVRPYYLVVAKGELKTYQSLYDNCTFVYKTKKKSMFECL